MENKLVYRKQVYIFEDGEIGRLEKKSGVCSIRSPSHFINLNTPDIDTALEIYGKMCNGYEEIELDQLDNTLAKHDQSNTLFKICDDGVTPIGKIIDKKHLEELKECGIDVVYNKDHDMYYILIM